MSAAEPRPGPSLEFAGPVARIRLRAPERHNALSLDDLGTFRSHLDQLRGTAGLRALVVSAGGRSFCSGHDLARFDPAETDAVPPPVEFAALADALEMLPVPTVCALQGNVYAGGIDLALACDFRVGVTGMVAGMPAARIGIHLYPGALRRYAARLTPGLAKRLCLLGATVPAEALLQGFFLDALVPPDALDDAVTEFLVPLTTNAPIAVQGMKAALDAFARGDVAADTLAQEGFLASFASADLRKGLGAARMKRAPSFTGH